MGNSISSRAVVVRFGDFELNQHAGELRREGTRVRLQEQPLQILQILLEQPGKVVSREEMRKRIWPSDTFVDFDHGINNAVKRLREALGDTADEPRFIQTLAKRGYRFIAEMTRSGAATERAVQASIAVLPFLNMSTDAENEFFAEGISEEIINVLARIDNLHVAARTSSFFFKGKHADIRLIGEQLNVRTVLEGSVRKADDHLRITVQLVNVADGYHLWSERYDRKLKDVFAIQDEIARSIAERLKVTLESDKAGHLVKTGTTHLDAYQLYLKGRALLYRRGGAIPRAAECFDRAVKLDPEYAIAWAGLADSYTTLGYYGLARPEASMPKGMEAARRAVALGPSLAEAHTALAMACLVGAWDKAEAEQEFLRAFELNPRYNQARHWYALFYLQLTEGRPKEGVAQARLALESDPLSAYSNAIFGLTCGLAGEHAEGVQACMRAVELDPDSYIARWCYLFDLYVNGQFEDAVATAETALMMSGRHYWVIFLLALILADWGKTTDAEALYAEMLARARRDYVPPATLAIAASAVDLKEQALIHAQEAFKIRDPHCQFFFSKHIVSKRLYAYPRFREMVARNGRSEWLQN